MLKIQYMSLLLPKIYWQMLPYGQVTDIQKNRLFNIEVPYMVWTLLIQCFNCLFFRGLVVFIVLDLSKPEELWNTLEVLLKQVGYIEYMG